MFCYPSLKVDVWVLSSKSLFLCALVAHIIILTLVIGITRTEPRFPTHHPVLSSESLGGQFEVLTWTIQKSRNHPEGCHCILLS
jgi:hypothetical protein